MGKFTMTHEINCDVDTFWKTFFDKGFNEELYRKQLGFPQFDIIDQKDTDTSITRTVKGTPKMEVPGALAKLLGNNFGYTEEGTFDKGTKTWRWKLTPSTLADKIRNVGMVRVEPLGDKKVRRTAEVEVEAKVFGVGGLIESTAEKQLRQGWDESAVFMNKYLQTTR